MPNKRKRAGRSALPPGECFGVAAAGEERRAAKRGASEPDAAIPEVSDSDGRNLSNTYLQTLQRVPLRSRPNCLASGGLDYFEWTASVAFDQGWLAFLIQDLREAKERCQKDQKADEWISLLGCADVRCHRNGVTRGNGRGTHYPFRVSYNGITIGLGDWNAGDRPHDNLYVCLKGRECLLLGGWRAYEEVREFVEKLGGEIKRELLSRVDLCLDVSNLKASELQEFVENRQFISRMRSVVPHAELVEGKKTGFTAGKRPQRLICYDKLNQLFGRCDSLYAEAWIQRRHGGETPASACRLEAQLCRTYLKQFGIDTPADLKANASALMSRFLLEQFRIVDRRIRKGERNQGRAKTLPIWEDLAEASQQIFGQIDQPLVRVDRRRVDPKRLIKQGFGCLRNAWLQRGVTIESIDDLQVEWWKVLQSQVSTDEALADFLEDYRLRETEFRG